MKYSILLVNNNRSKAYLQNFIKAGFSPEYAIVLHEDFVVRPENTFYDFAKELDSLNSKILNGDKILFFLCLGYYDESKRDLINTISDFKHGRFEGLHMEYWNHDFKNDIHEVIHWHEK